MLPENSLRDQMVQQARRQQDTPRSQGTIELDAAVLENRPGYPKQQIAEHFVNPCPVLVYLSPLLHLEVPANTL